MKLEVGKYYRTRDGRKVGPMVYTGKKPYSHIKWEFECDGTHYHENGASHMWYDIRQSDLIAEWTDTPEVGTLKEIGAQVGDVVECTADSSSYDVLPFGELYSHKLNVVHNKRMVDGCKFRIISRAPSALNTESLLGDHGGVMDDELFDVLDGPVRTVTTTRQAIVPGVYGRLRVSESITDSDDVCVEIVGGMAFSRHELTSAISTLTTIRDAMQANATA